MQAWKDFMATQTLSNEPIGDCAITDLSHLGIIRISGEDKWDFLQGQLTNDINAVTPGASQLSSYCSPKGRMLGSFWLFQRGDDLLIQLPKERLAPTLQRLRMFVLRSKVTLSDASDELVRFGLSGDCAPALLDAAPQEPWATTTTGEVTMIRLPGDRPRFDLVGPLSAMTPLWSRVSEKAVVTGPDFWALMDIRAGLPTVFEETAEAFVPQMANLQLLGGISFTKGCYTGQEVVARMQYLGKLKRRMYLAHVESDTRPRPGDELFAAGSTSGQGAGKVVDARPAGAEPGFEQRR